MASIAGVTNKIIDYGKQCLNVNDGWLKTWNGAPAHLLSAIPLVNNLFLRCKEEQLDFILNRAGLNQWLQVQSSQEPVGLDDQLLKTIPISCCLAVALDVALIWIAFKTCPATVAYTLSTTLLALLIDASQKAFSIRKIILKEFQVPHTLSTSDDAKGVELLMRSGVRLQDVETRISPLSFAGSKRIAELMVENGASVDISDYPKQRQPLHYVRDPETISYLVGKKANVHAKDRYQYSPLHYASLGKMGLTKDDDTLLPIENQLEAVRSLIANGAVVNAEAQKGITPLFFAAAHKKVGVVKLLMENGADPSLTTLKGDSPISWCPKLRRSGNEIDLQIANLLERTP